MRALNVKTIFALSILSWAVAVFLGLKFGAVSGFDFQILSELRLPRMIAASAVGIGLAVAGVILQALFSNPLCEPYTLGISSGSSVGAVIGISLGVQLNFLGLAGGAFIGALLFGGAIYFISTRPGVGNLSLLLAGVMLGLVGSSIVAVWMALADVNGIQSAIHWLLGDLSRARTAGSTVTLVAVVFLSALLWSRCRELDALLLGEEGAQSLGVDVHRTRRRMILLSSLLVGVCVSAGE